VRIGQDAVIGAGAVVIDDVPEFHVAAGVPARIVRDRRADTPSV
jgi:acetyltransferase-like isoleucine patch superfamily enzyme